MGTRFEVLFWGVTATFARSVYNQMHHDIRQLETDLSHYDEKSPISAINRNAGVKPVVVPRRVLSVLQRCHTHREKTGGLFDVVARDAARSASGRNLSPAPSGLLLSEDAGTAFLRDEGARIDLGGIGKGLALERVEELLNTHNVDHALVSFGESSILTRGHHPHGDVWTLGVSHLGDPETSLYHFDLTNHTLSTSGNTPRNDGHLRHPRTGRPKQGIETVSVHTESPVEAEVLSTALLLADREETRRLLTTYAPIQAVRIAYDRDGTSPALTELPQSTPT
jgi:thiamine biosynthesis lipoprotein